ncbi:MAG: PqiC family protein [Gemmatimonadota bacterium]|jgi:uncharacterized lipoprotein YmbA
MRLLLASILLGPWGCSLSRHAPPQQHYVLGESPRPDLPAPVADPGGPVIGLRPPRLAAYLDNPYIVVRRASNRVGFSEFHRWGEDLARGISRAVAGHLAPRASSWRIQIAPWGSQAQPDYVVQLHVLRFEGVVPEAGEASGGEAHVWATWEITRREDGALLSRGTTEVREPGWTVGDFDGLVSRLDQGLATLAQALLADLERVLAVRAARTQPLDAGREPHAERGSGPTGTTPDERW